MSCLSKENVYLVFGIGITGVAVVKFLIKNNYTFFIADDNADKLKNLKIDSTDVDEDLKIYNYNNQTLQDKKITHLILSPHVPAQHNPHKIVVLARENNTKIVSDLDLFYEYVQNFNIKYNTNKQIVAITGTNGKSTTTALTTFLFNKLGYPAVACGNIGVNVLSIDITKYDIFVVEISSYTLFLFKDVQFSTGVLLNISEDHLDYHGTMNNYIAAKKRVLQYSQNKIVCIEDEYTKKIATHDNNIVKIATSNILKSGWSWDNDKFYFNGNMLFQHHFANLPGKHNIANILCSVACTCTTIGIKTNNDIVNVVLKIKDFQDLPHRLQFVKQKDGVIFINDSKGTNVDSTQKALQTFSKDNVYLIAGGRRKTAGFLYLKNDLNNVKCVFLIGEAIDSFAEELKQLNIKYYKCEYMKTAVEQAFILAKQDKSMQPPITDKKTIILLSPLCASQDQYKNFEERGDDFVNNVNKL